MNRSRRSLLLSPLLVLVSKWALAAQSFLEVHPGPTQQELEAFCEKQGYYHYNETEFWAKVQEGDLVPDDQIIRDQDGSIRACRVQVTKVYDLDKGRRYYP